MKVHLECKLRKVLTKLTKTSQTKTWDSLACNVNNDISFEQHKKLHRYINNTS